MIPSLPEGVLADKKSLFGSGKLLIFFYFVRHFRLSVLNVNSLNFDENFSRLQLLRFSQKGPVSKKKLPILQFEAPQ